MGGGRIDQEEDGVGEDGGMVAKSAAKSFTPRRLRQAALALVHSPLITNVILGPMSAMKLACS